MILTAHKITKIHNIRRKMDKEQLSGMTVVRRKTGKLDWGLPPISFTKKELDKEKVSASGLKDHVSLTIPYGYHAQVKKIAQMYRMDQLFRRNIERLVEFICIGGEWELPVSDEDTLAKKIINTVLKKVTKQKHFWDAYSSQINQGVPNVIPGKDTIDAWIVRNILLNGMAPLDWQWGPMKVDSKTYTVPTIMTVQNPVSIVLYRVKDEFSQEETWLYLGRQTKKQIKENESYSPPAFSKNQKDLWKQLPAMGTGKRTGSFVIKYQWTPADNTATITAGTSVVGEGVYPVPPYIGLLGSTIQRQALAASDISTLDSIIGTVLLWKLGDDTKLKQANDEEILPNQPYPEEKDAAGVVTTKSAIDTISDKITEQISGDNGGSSSENSMIFAPYYLDGKYIEPTGITALTSSEKYVQPFIEILNAFGIIITPITGTPPKLEDLNRANLEQIISFIQREVKRFWETFCREIMLRNKSLTIEPNWSWNPMNTITDAYREQLAGLAKRGRLSPQSDMLLHNVDPAVEISKMRQNLANGTKDLLDESTPVTFVQQTVEPGGEKKEVSNTEPPKNGRPKDKDGK